MQYVEVPALQRWLDDGGAIVVDVRDAAAYKEANIPGAINIPLDQLNARALSDHAGKKIVVHCGGGTRAGRAYAKLIEEDDSLDVHVLQGGMRAWREHQR